MRPDIVWFGEIPYFMDEIEKHLFDADIFISIGTSGTVYPAAGFVNFARQHGAYAIELNLVPSDGASQFDEQHCGPASETVPKLLEQIKKWISA
jgi:NAD-dependent deacetylase